jgi:hypothetical protein
MSKFTRQEDRLKNLPKSLYDYANMVANKLRDDIENV